MKRAAIVIGSGISGLSISKMLQKNFTVTLLEKAAETGGLIKCRRIDGNLFHLVGGHVFNSKNKKVLDWFWAHFDKEKEFVQTKRNARILLDDQIIGYPIENFIYKLPSEKIRTITEELIDIACRKTEPAQAANFEDFLKKSFGNTLYDIYFGPYNTKLWNISLREIPLKWLDGKLPMPDVRSIFVSNIEKKEEMEMVHASFYYPRINGSQFIIDRLSEGTDIRLSSELVSIRYGNGSLAINDGEYTGDQVVYCGDVRKLSTIIQTKDKILQDAMAAVHDLPVNGTSNVLCETDDTDTSWLYLPEAKFLAHRIIYTGNFSDTNNGGSGRRTCVVEFSGKRTQEEMISELPLLPGNLKPLAFNYEPGSYIIHKHDTKQKIEALKKALQPYNIHLLGRFAEWEYYNMDKCMESAMKLADRLSIHLNKEL